MNKKNDMLAGLVEGKDEGVGWIDGPPQVAICWHIVFPKLAGNFNPRQCRAKLVGAIPIALWVLPTGNGAIVSIWNDRPPELVHLGR